MRRAALCFVSLLPLSACNVAGPRTIKVPTDEVPGVQLSTVVNHIKCEFLLYEKINSGLVNLRAGGILTFTRKDAMNADAGGEIKLPIATGVEVSGKLGGASGLIREQGFDWPFITSREQAAKEVDCGEAPPPITVTVGGQTATFEGRLLGLEGIAREHLKIRPGNPQLRPGGFRLTGSFQFVLKEEAGGGLKLLVVDVTGKRTRDSSATITYAIGTNYQEVLKSYPDLLDLETKKPDSEKPSPGSRSGGHENKPLKGDLALEKLKRDLPVTIILDGVPLRGKPKSLMPYLQGDHTVVIPPDAEAAKLDPIDVDQR